MSLGTTYSPHSPWEGLQVTNVEQCLHIVMVIGKCTDVFRGIFWLRGGGYVGETFHGGICHREEDFHEGGVAFSSII